MPLTVGSVVLDGIAFNTDPEPYEPLNWEKRHSVTMAIGGKVTIQDFGTFMKDNTLRLGSGENRFLDELIMAALHSRYRTHSVTYVLTDWLGNNFTVFIKNFIVIPFRRGRDVSGAPISLWHYTMELQVVTINQLLGVAYTGA